MSRELRENLSFHTEFILFVTVLDKSSLSTNQFRFYTLVMIQSNSVIKLRKAEYFVVITEETNVMVSSEKLIGRAETESDGTRKRTGGEVKGKKANGEGSQHSRALYRTRSIQHYYR